MRENEEESAANGGDEGGVRNRGRFARLVWNAVHHCRFTEVHACAYIRMYYRGWLHREYGSARANVRPYKRTRCMYGSCMRSSMCVRVLCTRVRYVMCLSVYVYATPVQPPCNPRAQVRLHTYTRAGARAQPHAQVCPVCVSRSYSILAALHMSRDAFRPMTRCKVIAREFRLGDKAECRRNG